MTLRKDTEYIIYCDDCKSLERILESVSPSSGQSPASASVFLIISKPTKVQHFTHLTLILCCIFSSVFQNTHLMHFIESTVLFLLLRLYFKKFTDLCQFACSFWSNIANLLITDKNVSNCVVCKLYLILEEICYFLQSNV